MGRKKIAQLTEQSVGLPALRTRWGYAGTGSTWGAGATSRLHTYGNSFTHGDQVSDSETWRMRRSFFLSFLWRCSRYSLIFSRARVSGIWISLY